MSSSPQRKGWSWHCFGLTDVGNQRQNNEDALLLSSLDAPAEGATLEGSFAAGGHGVLALVCDGLGGGAYGEVASAMATEIVHQQVRAGLAKGGDLSTFEAQADCLRTAVQAAHRAIVDRMTADSAYEGMGSTLTGLWLCGRRATVVQVGDSRLYRYREGSFEQLTHDQSPVGKLVQEGKLTPAQARTHPFKNFVDQVLGGNRDAVTPAIDDLALRAGDLLILCSDGLSDSLDDETMRQLIGHHLHETPAEISQRLMKAALRTSGRDNISILLVRVGSAKMHPLLSWLHRQRLEKIVN